jgi:hypothetical protein
VVDNARAFRVMVRNQAFDWVQRLAARRGYDVIGDGDVIGAAMEEYWEDYDEILLGPDARSPTRFIYDRHTSTVTQILHDPDDSNEWRITARVDLDTSRLTGRAELELISLGRHSPTFHPTSVQR